MINDRNRDDGYLLTTDPGRLDLALVHHWLSVESYWATGRSEETTRTLIDRSVSVGVYAPDGRQVAYARLVTDGAVFAYLADVFVDGPSRGRGLGTWLVRCLRDDLAARGLRHIALKTRDAHGVYAPLGFARADPERWMECDLTIAR